MLTRDKLILIKELREETGICLKEAKKCMIIVNWDLKNSIKYAYKHLLK
jgi:ribosomal protein L7/L12